MKLFPDLQDFWTGGYTNLQFLNRNTSTLVTEVGGGP